MKNGHELPGSGMFSDRGFCMFLQNERNTGDFMIFYHC